MKGVVFQASSELEKKDILNSIGSKVTIVTAIDLPSLTQLEIGLDRFSNNFPTGEDKLKIIFLSRISPMKNLDFALSIFSSVSAEVQFDIYGPKENLEYWKQCNLQIISRPKNI